MEFLHANTKSLLDSNLKDGNFINAKGKKVPEVPLCACFSAAVVSSSKGELDRVPRRLLS